MRIEERADALEDAIHHLSQPLTALTFVIELGRLQLTPEAWRQSLDTAAEECRRAVSALNAVRHAAAAMAAESIENA